MSPHFENGLKANQLLYATRVPAVNGAEGGRSQAFSLGEKPGDRARQIVSDRSQTFLLSENPGTGPGPCPPHIGSLTAHSAERGKGNFRVAGGAAANGLPTTAYVLLPHYTLCTLMRFVVPTTLTGVPAVTTTC